MTRKHIILSLIVISVVYLTLEISFFVSLLNVVRHDKVHTIDDMELYGRTLSGIGVSLILLKYLLLKKKQISTLVKVILIVTAFFTTYYSQKIAVDYYIESRSTATQERHYRAYMIHKSYTNNIFRLNEVDDTNSIKVKLAFLAPWAINNASSYDDKARLKPEYWTPVYESDFKNNKIFYYEQYLKVSREVSGLLDRYNQNINRERSRIRKLGNYEYRKVVSNYHRYVRRLGHDKITQRIKDEIYKESKIRMSSNWHPIKDKPEFINKFLYKYEHEIKSKQQESLEDLFNVHVPFKYLQTPLSSPSVIDKLNDNIDIFAYEKPFIVNLNLSSFYHYYKGIVPKNLVKKYQESRYDEVIMGDIGRYLIIPFVALLLSSICIILNLRSLIDLVVICTISKNNRTLYWCLYAGIWVMTIILPFLLSYSYLWGNSTILLKSHDNPLIRLLLNYSGNGAYILNSLFDNRIFLLF